MTSRRRTAKLPKRDLKFQASLPRVDHRLADIDIAAYLNRTRKWEAAPAEGWLYHIEDALSIVYLALIMAYTNQHRNAHNRVSRIYLRSCWFYVGLLLFQAAGERLAHFIRCGRGIGRWTSGKPADGRTTSLRKVELWLGAQPDLDPAEQQLLMVLDCPETREAFRLANQFKHGETFTWKGGGIAPALRVVKEPGDSKPRSLSWGYLPQHDLDKEVRKLTKAYRSFVPATQGLIEAYQKRYLACDRTDDLG